MRVIINTNSVEFCHNNKICLWASSEFCRHYTEKTSSVSLTVFLINPLGNFPHTHTHTHGFIEIIVSDSCISLNMQDLLNSTLPGDLDSRCQSFTARRGSVVHLADLVKWLREALLAARPAVVHRATTGDPMLLCS